VSFCAPEPEWARCSFSLRETWFRSAGAGRAQTLGRINSSVQGVSTSAGPRPGRILDDPRRQALTWWSSSNYATTRRR